ncbi:MAG: peptide chain release factor N(5)-glutamine methyltransferase [Candidatus Pacebacteria bacterium]|nr:peptide chain release factor N(5)-glutamine methyltransferase [Candidatus Paceibacterota bacterium]
MASQEIEWLLKEKYHGEKSSAFFADCKRLALGEPLAYLIGFVPFLGCKISLGSHPLIPRPETEHWTEEAINTIRGGATLPLGLDGEKVVRVLDLCAGSGCIGIAVAKALPNTQVDFGEIDQNHLPTIKLNLIENDVDLARTNIVHSHLFSNITGTYDFILSNPPYIDESLGRTDDSVRQHEPYISLFGGKEGLEVISKLIEDAPPHLSPGGQLWIEHEPEQSTTIQALGAKAGFSVTTHKDQYDVERYSILVLQ